MSSHLGDRATIYADGTMDGFVGGACARDIVRRQGLRALKRNAAILVKIRPDAASLEESGDGTSVTVPMTCASEGAVDVFIEPCLPRRRLVIAGLTPVAEALARIATAAEYDVLRFVEAQELASVQPSAAGSIHSLSELAPLCAGISEDDAKRTAAVVASQGHYDEESLEPILATAISYVGLLASRKRAATLKEDLAARGVPAHRLAEIRNPAGLDLGAKEPLGVAVSILAEIVALASASREHTAETQNRAGAIAIDPICKMEVETASARHSLEHNGETFYFCCSGCRQTFAADPHAYAGVAVTV